MKNGIFIVVDKDGRRMAAVHRNDGSFIYLTDLTVTPNIETLNGKPCQYLPKPLLVLVGGKNVFQAAHQDKPQQQPAAKPERKDWKKELRDTSHQQEPVREQTQPIMRDSFLLQYSRVPKDTRDLKSQLSDVDNFSLKLKQFAQYREYVKKVDKYTKEEEWERKFYFFNPSIKKDANGNEAVGKMEVLTNYEKLFNSKFRFQPADRISAAANSLFPSEGELIEREFQPAWRFVTGLGGHSVYETDITLHHVYGIPYMPASGIKGVLRSWVIYTKFNNDEKAALKDTTFCELFGCPTESALGKAHQGNLTFFDALPTEKPTLQPDVMNPHYPDYYSKKSAPTDTQSPIPVFFLTVAKTSFRFIIGSKKWNLDSTQFWDKTIEEWLVDALQEHGIGAKTAVGYGYMKPA